MLNKSEIESKLRKDENLDLIWIPSSESLHQTLLFRLKARKNINSIRGVVLIGEADNRLTNREQKEKAELIESNVSAEAFDKFCNEQLAEDLIIRIFC